LILKNAKGFTLVEIIIAVGLMAGLSMVAMQMMKTQTTSSASISAKMDEMEIKRNIILTLQDSIACKTTFAQKNIGQDLTAIKSSKGADLFSVGSNFGSNKVKITSMKTQDLNTFIGTLRDVELVIRTTKSVMGKETQAEFKVRLKVVALGASSPITDCYSDADTLIIGATIETCKSLGGIWDAATITCALPDYVSKSGDTMTGALAIASGNLDVNAGAVNISGNITTNGDVKISAGKQVCVGGNCRDFSAKNCQPDHMMTGIKANGDLECASIPVISANDCHGSWGACSLTCGTGEQTFVITSPATNGGAACAFSNGATRSCNTQACVANVNCSGSWGACSKTCGGGMQTFSITTPAEGNGAQCSTSHGAAQACNTNNCNCSATTSFGCSLSETNHNEVRSCTIPGDPGSCKKRGPWVKVPARWECNLNNKQFGSSVGCTSACIKSSTTVTKKCTNGNWN
jgi:prepilin-type N-terminal cleavage/methylation domain-containing protein